MVYILETTKLDTYSAISLLRARRDLAACVCMLGGSRGGGGLQTTIAFFQVRVTIINMYVRAVFCFMP